MFVLLYDFVVRRLTNALIRSSYAAVASPRALTRLLPASFLSSHSGCDFNGCGLQEGVLLFMNMNYCCYEGMIYVNKKVVFEE